MRCSLSASLALRLLVPSVLALWGCAQSPSIGAPSARESAPTDVRYEVDSHTLHYVAVPGGNARVLFIHGSPGTWKDWSKVLGNPRLRAKARLLAVDRPGWGDSPGGLVPDLQTQSQLLDPLIDRPEPTLVVAHSYGASIAMLLAQHRPRHVRGLLLIAPALSAKTLVPHWYDAFTRVALVRRLLPARLRAAVIEQSRLPSQLASLSEEWRDVTVPITILQGTDDRQVDPAVVTFARAQFKNSDLRVHLLDHEGHHLLRRRPDLVASSLLKLLDRTPPVRAGSSRDSCPE